MSKKTDRQTQMSLEIVNFAIQNHFAISPMGIDYFIEKFLKFNHCVCDAGRLACPCPESIEEVAQNGRCKCRLFWKDLKTFREIHWKEIFDGHQHSVDRELLHGVPE